MVDHARFEFLWPMTAAAAAGEVAASYLAEFAHALAGPEPAAVPPPDWTTPNRVVLDLQTMRLRDVSTGSMGVAALVCAPYALHAATVADLAAGHSVIEVLREKGPQRLFVTDWRSATYDMRFLAIDNYLADLNVAVDELGPPVDLVGLCQGGWLGLVYAARFPEKVRRLVLVGAPIDLQAGESKLSRLAAQVPLSVFHELVRRGNGRVLGQRVLELWGPALIPEDAHRVLQTNADLATEQLRALELRFRDWYAFTMDLPGTYYLEVVSWLFKENRIARKRFVALGRVVDLAAVRAPMYLVAAGADDLVSPAQLFAVEAMVGTPRKQIVMATEPCGHLNLFVGAKTLVHLWPKIAQWLVGEPAGGHGSQHRSARRSLISAGKAVSSVR
jgi:poly(3-hydroxyalkanoate) synthetase